MSELGYLSVTAGGCARMIGVLLAQLPTRSFSMNEVQVSVLENAPSMTIVTLAAAMIESIVGHAEWERDRVPEEQTAGPRSVWKRLGDLLADALGSSLVGRLSFGGDGKHEPLETFCQRVRQLADLAQPYPTVSPPSLA